MKNDKELIALRQPESVDDPLVVAIAAWMLDPAACSGMELGPPRVRISAWSSFVIFSPSLN